MKVAFFGPWYGEFGWELMTWQAYARNRAQEFDKVYVCSFPDMAPLYEDFAEFIPHKHPTRALDWQDITGIEYSMPGDVTEHVKPFKRYRVPEQKFIKFGEPTVSDFDVLVHARGIKKGGHKNYKKWLDVVAALGGNRVAAIGTAADFCFEGQTDLRGIPLKMLMQVIAGSKVVLGQSSGVMHLATLCDTPIVVWGDGKTYFGETLEKRYKETWNPFRSPVDFLVHNSWQPSVEDIVAAVLKRLGGQVMTEEYIEEIFVPEETEESPKVDDRTGQAVVGKANLVREPELLEEGISPQALERIMKHIRRGPEAGTPSPEQEETALADNLSPPERGADQGDLLREGDITGELGLQLEEGMARALGSAAVSGKWFLTISYVDPTDKGRYFHHWQTRDFPTNDLTKVLDHIKTEVAEKVVKRSLTWR